MDCYNISDGESNQIVYNNLLELFKKRNITPVIGAGCSCWAYPLWSDMLEKQGTSYGIGEKIKSLIDAGEYEAAAAALEEEVTPNGLKRLLQQVFRTSAMNEAATKCPAYLKKLPYLFNGPILTTNFDRVIEFLFKEEGLDCPDIVIPSDNFQSEKINSALHRNSSILVKMHGDVEDPQHLILTESSYNDAYGNNQEYPDFEKPMPAFLKKVLERNPLLFLGCSLNTDRTCSIIRGCASNSQQFAILELPEETENADNPFQPVLQKKNKQFIQAWKERREYILQELNIQAIWYPYKKHEALDVFFTKLSEDLGINFKTNTSLSTFRLVSKLPQPRQYFIGRDDQIEAIHKNFSCGNHVMFLEGIGGIGKSELAKRYVVKYKHEYKNILFVTYCTSLKDLICDSSAILIENLVQSPEESEYAFYQRKLQQLQILANDKTLLIIDNFDVNSDPEMEKFLEGPYDVIFTTRNAHSGYPSIYVTEIRDFNVIMEIFSQNYEESIDKDDIPYLKEIFEYVQYHTYAVELIAKQMAASSLKARDMLRLLKEGTLSYSITETITGRRNQKTAFQHITSLFDIGRLNESEQKIMMYLSLMGTAGVSAGRLKEWAELPSYETVNQLIKRSWVRKEAERRYSLHPLVCEVVRSNLTPSVENCRSFLTQIAKFCHGAWCREYQENLVVANNILAVLEYFKILDGHEIRIFAPCAYFLWQVGKFDDAIRYCTKLYDACLKEFGEASIETGYAARCVGGCYFNAGKIEKSIPWYELSLHCTKLATNEDCEELAISYEKVGRCYTWKENPNQNFNKAKQNFETALDIHLRLRDAIKSGKKLSCLDNVWTYDLGASEGYIAGTYMELGRMYQAMNDYKKALECIVKHEEITKVYQPDNLSGLAYSYYDQGFCRYHLGLQAKESGDMVKTMEEFQQAAQKLEAALTINVKMRGNLAIDTISNYETLADVYMAMAKEFYDRAASEYSIAKNIAINLLGKSCKRVQRIQEKWKESIG